MSVIVIDDQVVHYETFGRGRPVLFLHGWLGSWRYWMPTMEFVSKDFRTYSFDFWGFGDSDKTSTAKSISITNFSDQVIRFLDAMGIDKVPLVGHSMGGMVALKTAIRHPNRISRVAAIGAPIVGTSLSGLLKLTDNQYVSRAMARVPVVTKFLFRWFLGNVNDTAYGEILDDSVKPTEESLRRAVGSMMRTDLRPELEQLTIPTLIIHGARDDIVNPNQADIFLQRDMANTQVFVMPESRHFPFLDEPAQFNKVLHAFLKRPVNEARAAAEAA
ncbi:MAG TPA: alpha/beta hydrolase [Herpetosiphon sp.]|uniref:Alpha/beta hydrolase fold n=1 Tax=Herpetosiphon aurantiacus (strain ATCC 23779 / DSM 785 / 114-95) TaxID=316274 RepID=A9AUC4_HERA2|nr:alpha/beta hydrolase [Herpetosiphon sp.]ABX03043.1 alpha/beta hydrolase fold [Herpetosiphon aurantiacus DSM 785]MCA0352363.1 alpha/beta hydrolase [Chloroflexota bacterium]HBW50854.1 alpha/beta hydrolase [Herpetosiphon sp.]